MSRDQVIREVLKDAGELRRIDRIEAKLTLYTGPAFNSPRTLVWIVAVAGDVHPEFGNGWTGRWAEFFLDATTGDMVNDGSGDFAAGDKEAWPPGFDSIKDLAAR